MSVATACCRAVSSTTPTVPFTGDPPLGRDGHRRPLVVNPISKPACQPYWTCQQSGRVAIARRVLRIPPDRLREIFRSRLLPQPGGFEGLSVVEGLERHQLPRGTVQTCVRSRSIYPADPTAVSSTQLTTWSAPVDDLRLPSSCSPDEASEVVAKNAIRAGPVPTLGVSESAVRNVRVRHRGAQAKEASRSRRLNASMPCRTISTFSCDIAYSESPAASRASARSMEAQDRSDYLPSRNRTGRTGEPQSSALALPCRLPVRRRTTTPSPASRCIPRSRVSSSKASAQADSPDGLDARRPRQAVRSSAGLEDSIRVEQLSYALESPRFRRRMAARTTSTFSCDIAYSAARRLRGPRRIGVDAVIGRLSVLERVDDARAEARPRRRSLPVRAS